MFCRENRWLLGSEPLVKKILLYILTAKHYEAYQHHVFFQVHSVPAPHLLVVLWPQTLVIRCLLICRVRWGRKQPICHLITQTNTQVAAFSSPSSAPLSVPPCPDCWFHRVTRTVPHFPYDPRLCLLWCVLHLCLWPYFWLCPLLQFEDFEAESAEWEMNSDVAPPFYSISNAAGLWAHPSSTRAVNKPPLSALPNLSYFSNSPFPPLISFSLPHGSCFSPLVANSAILLSESLENKEVNFWKALMWLRVWIIIATNRSHILSTCMENVKVDLICKKQSCCTWKIPPKNLANLIQINQNQLKR